MECLSWKALKEESSGFVCINRSLRFGKYAGEGLAAADGRNSEQKGTMPDLGLCWGQGWGDLGWLGPPGTVGLRSQTLAQEGASKDSISIPSSG